MFVSACASLELIRQRCWSPRWPHLLWVSCCSPKTEEEAAPSCPTRRDLIQADLALAMGGICEPASALLPQVPNRL